MDIKQIFSPPVFEDEEKSRNARFLYIVSWFVALLMSGLTIYQIVSGGVAAINYVLILNAVLVLILTHRGRIRMASFVLVVVTWAILTYQAWSAGGIRDSTFFAYVLVILLANLMLGWQAGLVVAGFSILAGWIFAYAETNGLKQLELDPAYDITAEFTVIFGLAAVILAVTTATLRNAFHRARRSEQSLTESNQELQALSISLEEQVATRTRRLEIIAALNERLTGILHVEELVAEVVNQIQENFNYYHAHIYLLDDRREALVVAAGTGEAGAAMIADSHSIALDASTSLVARAARTGGVVKVDNVRQAEDWLPNPLLPDTYAEMAVPITLEGQVVGVLDVQQNKVAGLDEGDADLLRSLANQVAVAIRNARLFEEVETALAEARTTQERYLEQSWQQANVAARGGQYHYARPEAAPLSEAAIVQAKQTALAHHDPAIVALEQNGSEDVTETPAKPIVAPIKLRNTAIGALQLHPLRADQAWSEDDLAVVEAVVDELAQTAENLRLFEETQERAGREATIREITDKLRAAPSLDALLETAGRELGQRLDVPQTVLELGVDPGTNIAKDNGQ